MLFLPTALFSTLFVICAYFHLTTKIAHNICRKPHADWGEVIMMIVFVTVSWIGVIVFKKSLDWAYKKFKFSKFEQVRNNIFIGIGFIAIISADAKLDMRQNSQIDVDFTYTASTFFVAFYYFFIYESAKCCKLEVNNSTNYQIAQCILLSVNAIALYLSAIHRSWNDNAYISLQILYSVFCLTSTFDLLSIFMGKLKLKEEEVVVDSQEKKIDVFVCAAPDMDLQAKHAKHLMDILNGDREGCDCDNEQGDYNSNIYP